MGRMLLPLPTGFNAVAVGLLAVRRVAWLLTAPAEVASPNDGPRGAPLMAPAALSALLIASAICYFTVDCEFFASCRILKLLDQSAVVEDAASRLDTRA